MHVNSHFIARADGTFAGMDFSCRCALGKGGVIGADLKREGDGASPIGIWQTRRLFYRPDRTQPPETRLPKVPLRADDGWCDAPEDPLYNRPVALPYPASAEKLWRADHVYNLIVELGYNDDPIFPGHGSAIFLHLAREDYRPTEGCVALAEPDLRTVLRFLTPESLIEIAL
jgi:L,D-peptidoglycan transpeptidase YkuD (ErfK/YbiS/YcfS/YnhG family)